MPEDETEMTFTITNPKGCGWVLLAAVLMWAAFGLACWAVLFR